MKLSTAKRRINKTLDELSQSVVDDWYANFKNGYIKGYEDARQGKSPMYAEAHRVADTPQTESTGSPIGDYRDGVGAWQTERMTEEEIDTMLAKALVGQTDCGWK